MYIKRKFRKAAPGNSSFSQLNKNPFSISTLKLPFRKCITYALDCSFIKSSLLRKIFIVCCQFNKLKSMLDELKKKHSKKRKVSK